MDGTVARLFDGLLNTVVIARWRLYALFSRDLEISKCVRRCHMYGMSDELVTQVLTSETSPGRLSCIRICDCLAELHLAIDFVSSSSDL